MLIPAVVANLYFAVLHAHRKLGGGLVSRRGQGLSRSYAESRAVTRTDDLIAFHRAAGELPAVVRADVFDRVVFTAEVEYDDGRVVHRYHSPRPGRKLAHLCHGGPVRHLG